MLEDQIDLAILFTTIIIGVAYLRTQRQRKRTRKQWVRKWILKRKKFGAYAALLFDLRNSDTTSYSNFLRMDKVAFEEILNKVRLHIQKADTRFRESISAEERLALTLRYLATGDS